MKPSEVLLAARELVAGGWSRRLYARGPTGREVDELSDDAVCFCAVGALLRATSSDAYDPSDDFREAKWMLENTVRAQVGIASWNDDPTTTHLDVVQAFERAALLAMSEGK